MDGQAKPKKIILITILGETNVGKTSLINVYTGIGFSSDYVATIGMDKFEKEVQIESGEIVKLRLWDTAGQEKYNSIALSTIKNTKGVVVVFDLTSKKSFEKVSDWINQVRELTSKVPISLFGNKSDLSNREVTQEEIDKLCEEQNMIYFETSAKNNTGIDEGFKKMANLSAEIFKDRFNNNTLLRKTENKQNKKKCC